MLRALFGVVRKYASHKSNQHDRYEGESHSSSISLSVSSCSSEDILLIKSTVTVKDFHSEVTRSYDDVLILISRLSRELNLKGVQQPATSALNYVPFCGKPMSQKIKEVSSLLSFLCARRLNRCDKLEVYSFLKLKSELVEYDERNCLEIQEFWAGNPNNRRLLGEKKEEVCRQPEIHRDPLHPSQGDLNIPAYGEYRIDLVQLIPDQCYKAGSRSDKHFLDVYVPRRNVKMSGRKLPKPRLLPCVIHVHGGGFVRGSRKYGFYGAPSMAAGYAENGLVCFAPSYRLGQYPLHLQDVIEAVKWVVENCHTFGGDPNIIFLSGHSAGGSIVSLLATSAKWCVEKAVNSSLTLPTSSLGASFKFKVRGVISISAVMTMNGPLNSKWKNFIWRKVFFKFFGAFHISETCLLLVASVT